MPSLAFHHHDPGFGQSREMRVRSLRRQADRLRQFAGREGAPVQEGPKDARPGGAAVRGGSLGKA